MDDEDLAALVSRLNRRLRAAEEPLLADAGLSMWEYVVLARLAGGDAESQQALARAMNYDKTRLIGLLDGLEGRELVARAPEPPDRRAHRVRLTDAGRERHAAARKAIHAMEDELLRDLSATEQRSLRDALARLAGPSGSHQLG
jgi:DNA-binding MarR family transcriptional regulator